MPDTGNGVANPVAPTLSVRALRLPENQTGVPGVAEMVGGLTLVQNRLNAQLLQTNFSAVMDEATLRANLLQPNPPSIYAVRWQGHQCFCAWRAGELLGLIDVGAGFVGEHLLLPDDAPLGFLRFLVLPERPEQMEDVVEALLSAAERFWRQQHVGHIVAFDASTGYPQFQAGLGALPGGWDTHMRVLTQAGFQLTDRFYALRRPLDQPLEELIPVGQLSLVMRGKPADRHYQIYRQVDQIGRARVRELTVAEGQHTVRIANLLDLYIDAEWRGQNIGKWLLRRVLNDALLQGFHQVLVHVPHRAFILQNLLTQHGFQEQNYRGYTLEKALTR
ncbi:MAG: GNAT family N-acetyltransferase [Caldilineaceae bacterium]|nr:GNAT family N-acetyltransferase [Caldilineaceae bacterium]